MNITAHNHSIRHDCAIDADTIKRLQKILDDYLKKEGAQIHTYRFRTSLLDLVYFMGIAIDQNRFMFADGAEQFRKILRDELIPREIIS